MITKIEASNFKALKLISQTVRPFQILIGPNASGKSTFLDIPSFIGDLLSLGLTGAIEKRAENPTNLLFDKAYKTIEFGVEFELSDLELPTLIADKKYTTSFFRYEIAINFDKDKAEIEGERLILVNNDEYILAYDQADKLPTKVFYNIRNNSVFTKMMIRSARQTVVINSLDPTANTMPGFYLDPDRSALAAVFHDSQRYLQHLKIIDYFKKNITKVFLDSEKLKYTSRPTKATDIDGGSLAYLIDELKANNSELYTEWMNHIRVTLPELETLRIVKLEEEVGKRLEVKYINTDYIPSRLISDGTLRMIALTLIGYSNATNQLYLIEEPENGVHPSSIELIYQALSSTYNNQIMVATHSPVFLSIAKPEDIIIFSKRPDGSVTTTSGTNHPHLKALKDTSQIGLLFASGILD